MSDADDFGGAPEQDIEADLSDDGDDAGGGGIPGLPSKLEAIMPEQVTQMMSLMREDNGIAKVLMQPAYVPDENGDPKVSQAEVIADLINIQRLDTKRIAEEVGADVEVGRVTPAKAAVMMQNLVKQESMELVEAFNDIEDDHERILQEVADEETVEAHREQKEAVSYFAQAVEEAEDAE